MHLSIFSSTVLIYMLCAYRQQQLKYRPTVRLDYVTKETVRKTYREGCQYLEVKFSARVSGAR
jgi:hypothetical protein